MILMVSGRTDVVTLYTPWFINRYKEGFVDVRNPFYKEKISRIYFDDVDLILFCTKNPIPIIKYLGKIDKKIIFHITLTPYKKEIEPNLPPKGVIIEAIKKVSKIVGKDYTYVRYDPIFISDKYTIQYHIKSFEHLCKLLNGHIKHIIVSFIDNYKNVRKNKNILNIKEITEEDYKIIGEKFSAIAKKYNMKVQTCSEEKTLIEYGFIKGECLSKELAYNLTGKKYPRWKSRNNKNCYCVEIKDIGVYNTCNHMCKYCYANYDEDKVKDNIKKHDPTNTFLIE